MSFAEPPADRPCRILTLVGTRPEVIKLAPVVRALEARGDRFDPVLASTGQHREMLALALGDFGLRPAHELGLMEPDQSLAGFASRALAAIAELVDSVAPDAVLAQGDTTTVMAASLAAFYAGVPFGHVEAGLRTGDRRNPFPEEINRRIAGVAATWHFAPTERARQNLLAEGIADDTIVVTGNTIVDALTGIDPAGVHVPALAGIPPDHRVILVTAHRRESLGDPLRSICRALLSIVDAREDVTIVYPVHPNPHVSAIAREVLAGRERIRLVAPLSYRELLATMKRSALVLTDSGGIQEEAPTMGAPVLVLREATERPELIERGAGLLVGTDEERIATTALRLLDDDGARRAMITGSNPFGDGRAAERIVAYLEREVGHRVAREKS